MKSQSPELAPLAEVARQLQEVHAQAKALGIFTADRELLECPKCGLLEDVAFDGTLMTYRENEAALIDTGLRFRESDPGRFICPGCGSEVSERACALE